MLTTIVISSCIIFGLLKLIEHQSQLCQSSVLYVCIHVFLVKERVLVRVVSGLVEA